MDQVATKSPLDTAGSNLQRLFTLRNIEIIGITAAIIIAVGFFDLALPLGPLAIILGLITCLNLYTWWRLKSGRRIHDGEIFIQMLLDVAGLTGIFYYTGGASNLFVWFYLLPLMIAATILPRIYTWSMAVVTIICYSALFIIDAPLDSGQAHHGDANGFQTHIFGMWMGFVMSAGFVAVIIVGMAHTLRQRDRHLAEAREQALQNERLIALGTLAAGAAHELGTPLGTIAILTAELENEYADPAHRDLQKKLGILHSQVDRCKDALSVISADAGADRAESGHQLPVKVYLDEVIREWQAQRPDATLETRIGSTKDNVAIIAERTLTQALINILNNAADASPDDVQLEASWTATELLLGIADRGAGIAQNIHHQLGKSPVSTKAGGLGVGLYLAHATLQRLGGAVAISNRGNGGTLTRITLPLITSAT